MVAASAHEVSPPWPAHPPLPIQPAPRRALRCLTVAIVRCLAGAECPEGKGRSRGELWMRQGMGPVLLRVLLMVAACNAVRMTAMHVVSVRSGPRVAVGSRCELCPFDAYVLRPYWWSWPRGPWKGCWGRVAPPVRRVYRRPSADAVFSGFVHTYARLSDPLSCPTCRCTNSIRVGARNS